MTTKQPEYSLFIKQSDIDNVIQSSNDDKSTAYIILQNNELQSKYSSISKELTALTSEKEEIEDYNDKLERGKAHIQGITKNQYLISQEKTKMIDFYKDRYHFMFYHYLQSYIIHIPYNFLLFFSVFSMKIKFAIFILTYSFYFNHCFDMYNYRKESLSGVVITDINEELQNLDKSNDYLHELIDNF